MKLVRDITGRFRERPHYELDELEEECEQTAFTFLEERYGQVLFPIPTNALIVLVEQYTEDLDLFADLSGEGASVQGSPSFSPTASRGCGSRANSRSSPGARTGCAPRWPTSTGMCGCMRRCWRTGGAGRATQVLAANAAAVKHANGLDGMAGGLRIRRALDAAEQGKAFG